MNEFNQRFAGLSEPQQQARYRRLAQACLAHYAVVAGEIIFVAHNAGIVYRVESPQGKFLLKIAEAIGEGGGDVDPEYLTAGLYWLDALARETNLIVQQPLANRDGELVTEVDFADLSQPFYCSLQRWLDGEQLRDPSAAQAYQIGSLMAQLHQHGSQWQTPSALQYDVAWVSANLATFAQVKTLDILTAAEWNNVEWAVDRIQQTLQTIGTDPQVWGLVHGDIHHQNLLVVAHGQLALIDFGVLIRAHYGYELGVTLYHLMYLDAPTRQALVAGYQAEHELTLPAMSLEAFLCMAALANLAFNVELPDQRTTRLFIRNVREFAGIFCHYLLRDIPFALEPYNYVR